jgi:hypothetical protein
VVGVRTRYRLDGSGFNSKLRQVIFIFSAPMETGPVAEMNRVVPMQRSVTPSDMYRQLSAACGEKARACSTVFNWIRGFDPGKEIAQAAVGGWYRDTPIEWSHEAIRKLPRRWQP